MSLYNFWEKRWAGQKSRKDEKTNTHLSQNVSKKEHFFET